MLPYIEYAYGIYHVIGGLNKISQAMAKVVEEEGGRIVKNTPVKQLIIKGREVCGVELESGDKILCDDVVINADFAYAMTQLVAPGILKKYTDANLQKKQYSCSTFMIYLGINKKFTDLPHHNIIFASDYRKNVEEMSEKKIISQDPSFYVQNASVSDSTLAPEGKSAVYILVPVPNNKSKIDWATIKDDFKNKIINMAIDKGGFEGLKDHIEVEKVITPDDWGKSYNVYLGATFNLAHTMKQLLYFRPRNKFEELDHCYLVGGGTHPGSGLPTIYESARITSNLLCKHYGIDFQLPTTLREKDLVKRAT
jgi:phytoene desaturase